MPNLLSSRINLRLNAPYLRLEVTVYVLDIKLVSRFRLNISCERPSAGIGLGIRDSFGKGALGNAEVDVVEYVLYCGEEGGVVGAQGLEFFVHEAKSCRPGNTDIVNHHGSWG